MFRVPIAWLAVVLIGGAAPVKDPKAVPAKLLNTASASQQPSLNDSSAFDVEAEKDMLELANQARAQAGLVPLQADEGLLQAARVHAVAMAGRQQLSHQFAGE